MAPLTRSTPVNTIAATDPLQIQHFTHQHVLHKIHMPLEFNCDGCNTRGYGARFRCPVCDFDLHQQCAVSPLRVYSGRHPQHQLQLVNRPGDPRCCGVCRGLTNGLSYMCECQTCEFSVHPICVANGDPFGTLERSQQMGGTQLVNMNQHQQQQQQQPMQQHGMPMMVFNGNYNGVNTNQRIQQQQIYQHGVPAATMFGGYNQSVMFNQQQQQQQQQPATSSKYSNMGKLAANILTTSIIGVPLFNQRN